MSNTYLQDFGYLQEELLHYKRCTAFFEEKSKGARAQLMMELNQFLNHRLENARLYADRPAPNGKEIVGIIDEIIAKLKELNNE